MQRELKELTQTEYSFPADVDDENYWKTGEGNWFVGLLIVWHKPIKKAFLNWQSKTRGSVLVFTYSIDAYRVRGGG